MRRTTLRAAVGAAALAVVVTACSGSSSGGADSSATQSPSATATATATALPYVITAVPRAPATASILSRSATVLRKRFSDLGVDASVTVNTSDKSLRVSVSQADSDSAKFLITERGLVEFSRVFQARNSPAQTCRPNADAFGKKAIAAGGAVQCDPADGLILLLGPVALTQANFTNAVAKTSPGISGWEVALTLDHPGVTAWGALTRGAYASTGSGDAGFATCKPPRGCNALAFVIDGGLVEVPSVPRAGGLPGTTAAISGDFSEALAKRIAATLKSGPLPVAFAVP